MAFSFNGTDQYISANSAPATGAPLTLFVNGLSTTLTAQQFALALGNSTVSSGQFIAAVFGGDISGDPVRAFLSEAIVNASANSNAAYQTNVYQNIAAVFASTTSRTVYLNGTASTPNTDARTPTGIDRLGIGALVRQNVAAYLSGRAAECAIWNVALTDAEITSLSKGFKPYRIRPQSLVFYAPLIRNLQDIKAGLALTNNNSATVAAHPRVY